MDWADQFAGPDLFPGQRRVIREILENEDHPYHPYVLNFLQNVDPEVLKTLAVNFFVNTALIGWPKQEKLRKELNCNIPWAILLDPTSACNLHCTGCWAAEYGNRLNLTYEEIDSIVTQGKELGVYFYIYTGGVGSKTLSPPSPWRATRLPPTDAGARGSIRRWSGP